MTNRQLGDMFGGLSYSAVSKANERFSEKIRKSRVLKNNVNKIANKMSYVKGCPITRYFAPFDFLREKRAFSNLQFARSIR